MSKREVFQTGFYKGLDSKEYNKKITVYKLKPFGLVAKFASGKECEVDSIWCHCFIDSYKNRGKNGKHL